MSEAKSTSRAKTSDPKVGCDAILSETMTMQKLERVERLHESKMRTTLLGRWIKQDQEAERWLPEQPGVERSMPDSPCWLGAALESNC